MATEQQARWPLSWISRWHHGLVFGRRTQVLARLLAKQIPAKSTVLDIGCGDGTIGRLIAGQRPDLAVQGVEFLVRPGCKIACQAFDGKTLPFADNSIDVCMFVDVLHHTVDVRVLLREAARVSSGLVLLKDHVSENSLDHATLGLMDWVGNRPHGVPLPYNYQSERGWQQHFAACGLREVAWNGEVPLYAPPLSWVFERKLHFIALLRK